MGLGAEFHAVDRSFPGVKISSQVSTRLPRLLLDDLSETRTVTSHGSILNQTKPILNPPAGTW
jgi:hypothetical protein